MGLEICSNVLRMKSVVTKFGMKSLNFEQKQRRMEGAHVIINEVKDDAYGMTTKLKLSRHSGGILHHQEKKAQQVRFKIQDMFPEFSDFKNFCPKTKP